MAILAADVVDYSRLSEAGEVDTHVRLRALRVQTIDPCVVSYRGVIIKNTGDGFLASFDSAVDAVRCAVELQHDLAASEASLAHTSAGYDCASASMLERLSLKPRTFTGQAST